MAIVDALSMHMVLSLWSSDQARRYNFLLGPAQNANNKVIKQF